MEMMVDQQKQITDAFLSDFKELLRRYNATFDMCCDMCSEAHVEIDFDAMYNENGNLVRPYINFQLPHYINPD